jgi:hypothetical protein
LSCFEICSSVLPVIFDTYLEIPKQLGFRVLVVAYPTSSNTRKVCNLIHHFLSLRLPVFSNRHSSKCLDVATVICPFEAAVVVVIVAAPEAAAMVAQAAVAVTAVTVVTGVTAVIGAVAVTVAVVVVDVAGLNPPPGKFICSISGETHI